MLIFSETPLSSFSAKPTLSSRAFTAYAREPTNIRRFYCIYRLLISVLTQEPHQELLSVGARRTLALSYEDWLTYQLTVLECVRLTHIIYILFRTYLSSFAIYKTNQYSLLLSFQSSSEVLRQQPENHGAGKAHDPDPTTRPSKRIPPYQSSETSKWKTSEYPP
jgi:hypothetical protein